MKAVYVTEVKSLFHNMIAPIFIAVTTAVDGIYFMAQNISNGNTFFSQALINSLFILVVTVPILTMRSFAEERSSKTDQLLFTCPTGIVEITLGKYFALVTVFVIPLAFCAFCPLIIKSFGEAHLVPDYAFMLLYLFTGMLFIAIGMFISSLTDNQVIAAVGAFGALLVLYLWYELVNYLPTDPQGTMIALIVVTALLGLIVYSFGKNVVNTLWVIVVGVAVTEAIYFIKPELYENLLNTALRGLSIMTMMRNAALYSLIDIGGIAKLLIFTAVFLILICQSIQKRRWN